MVAATCTTGCWDRVEIDHLAIVDALAFDTAPGGQVRVTLNIALPLGLHLGGGTTGGATGAATPASAVVSAAGDSISAAMSHLQAQLPHRIFDGQVNAVLIGGPLAAGGGVAEVIDFLLRSRSARLSTMLFLTPGAAGPLLLITPPYRSLPGNTLNLEAKQDLVPTLETYQASAMLLESGRGAIVPEVVTEHPKPAPGEPGQPTPPRQQTPAAEVPAHLALHGAGLLRGPTLVGQMTESQARGSLWLLGRVHRVTTVLHSPDGATITCEIDEGRIRRRAVLRAGRPVVLVQVQAAALVRGVSGTPLNLADPQVINRLSGLLQAAIRAQAEGALTAARASNDDVFGFGRLIATGLPRTWKAIGPKWGTLFADLPVDVTVRATIRAPGNAIQPV